MHTDNKEKRQKRNKGGERWDLDQIKAKEKETQNNWLSSFKILN